MKVSYSEKLKDPRWQKKRLEVLQRDNFTCLACGSAEKTLHVHHCYYVGKRNPWEYDSDSLLTFCENCHDEVDDVHAPSWWWAIHWECAATSALKIARAEFPENLNGDGGPFQDLLSAVVAHSELTDVETPLPEIARTICDALFWGVLNDRTLLELRRQTSSARNRGLGIESKPEPVAA